jgi:hypothetical protein
MLDVSTDRNRTISARQSNVSTALRPSMTSRSMEERLWSEFGARHQMRNLSHLKVILVGFGAGERGKIVNALAALDVSKTASIKEIAGLTGADEVIREFDLVLVNLDAFEDTWTGVEELMCFRKQHPAVSVILLSGNTPHDDLGAERRAICDSTLRLPLNTSRFADGVQAALLNHSRSMDAVTRQ